MRPDSTHPVPLLLKKILPFISDPPKKKKGLHHLARLITLLAPYSHPSSRLECNSESLSRSSARNRAYYVVPRPPTSFAWLPSIALRTKVKTWKGNFSYQRGRRTINGLFSVCCCRNPRKDGAKACWDARNGKPALTNICYALDLLCYFLFF